MTTPSTEPNAQSSTQQTAQPSNETSTDPAAQLTSESSAVQSLATVLQDQGLSITTAESCTGGLIAAALTSLAGSSVYFRSGLVTYSNERKRRDLNVPARTLADHGAVSEATVLAMAEGARKRDNADVSIAVSGVAGPDGGTDDKPVGTVWIAWSIPVQHRHQIDAVRFEFKGDRTEIRQAAVFEALRGTIARLNSANDSNT